MHLKPGKETVMIIPDLQCPFEHPDALAFACWARDKYNPTIIVNIGDEIDMHALSDYDHDPDGLSAGDELKKAIKHLSGWYREFPVTNVCTSNHTARIFRRAFKYGIPRAYLRDYADFMKAPEGWQWEDSFEIDGVLYIHGEGFSGATGATKAAHAFMQPTVIGHLHSHAGIQYYANKKELIYGFNTGCLIDVNAYAFNYGKLYPIKPVLGIGLVVKGVPQFIPMLLDEKGMWAYRNQYKSPKKYSYICPSCGSFNVEKRGYSRTYNKKAARIRCMDCDKWSQIDAGQ